MDQQSQSPVAGPQGESAANLQRLPSLIRRKVVGKSPGNLPVGLAGNVQPGNNVESKRNYFQPHIASPPALNIGAGSSHKSAPFIQSIMPAPEREVQPAGTNGSNNPNEQKANAGGTLTRQASLRRDVSLQITNRHGAAQQEIENGNVILYRRPNFFLRTAYRPGLRQNPLRKPTGNTTVMPKVMPHQETRIADSNTHLMPSVTLNTTKQTRAIPLPAWLEAITVVLSLVGTFVAHAYNMFNFPRYELDEGTYMSNAWAITQGLISPDPYGYGHPPLAWMQIAAWIKLSGGFFAFGNAINSGRVLMIFFAAGSGLLTYMIIRRLEGNRTAGILALVIFSFSPLAITYQRQVLLDNVAIFWLLLSLYLLVVGNSRLVYIVSSALCFGIAILSKEVLLLFVPGMLYAVWLHTTSFQRKFALVAFTYTTIAFVSGFVLLALLKGELFPYAWHLPCDTHTHLSLIDTYLYQGSRTQTEGSFLGSLKNWVAGDKLFMLGSLGTMFLNLIVGWWRRKQLLMALLAISFWFLLVRGGVVFAFYLIPLIGLMALISAMAINMLFGWLGKLIHLDLVRVALILGVIAMLVQYDFQ